MSSSRTPLLIGLGTVLVAGVLAGVLWKVSERRDGQRTRTPPPRRQVRSAGRQAEPPPTVTPPPPAVPGVDPLAGAGPVEGGMRVVPLPPPAPQPGDEEARLDMQVPLEEMRKEVERRILERLGPGLAREKREAIVAAAGKLQLSQRNLARRQAKGDGVAEAEAAHNALIEEQEAILRRVLSEAEYDSFMKEAGP